MLDEKSLRVATQWLYDNRHTGYWTYPILLSDNVSAKVKALNLTHDEASMVFSVLEELEFLKPTEAEPLIVEGRGYTKFVVNYAKLREYYWFAHPPFYYGLLPESWVYRVEKYWVWVLAFVALLLTSFIGGWLGVVGENLAQ